MINVQPMFERVPEPALRRLRIRMRGVLRQAGYQHPPQQRAGSQDAGGYFSVYRGTDTPSHPRLREPLIGETQLSVKEIAHARKIGVIA